MTSHRLQSLVHPIIGVVKGVKASPHVVQYLGVPYATLQDAFARGQPITYTKSEFVLDATQHGPTVINPPGVCDREQELIQARISYTPRRQSATQGLTLNISVPASTKASKGLPVLVFVHGGGFASGSANHPHYNLEKLVELSVQDRNPIIAIGVNYRVGIPGFLSSTALKAAGYKPNNGLDDQRVALRWIKRHISGFGGDGERITFLGQSAGAVAGNIHLESAEPLFEQYISMAGTAFSRPRRVEAIQKAYDGLMRDLGVADASPEEQVQRLLKEVDQDDFAARTRKYNLGPTLDGDLVPEALVFRNQVDPAAAFKTFPGMEYCRRVLVGDCQFDGLPFVSRLADRTDILPKTLAESLTTQLDPLDPALAPKLISAYGLDVLAESNSASTTRPVLNVGSDIHFGLPAIAVANIWANSHVEGTKAFLYHFNCPNPWDGPWKGEATHILDVAFALQNYNNQLSPGQRQCAERFGSDVVRFVNGADVWAGYNPNSSPTAIMIYTAPAESEHDESHVVDDPSTEYTSRRTFIQDLGKEPVWDKVMHSWQAFMMAGARL